MRHLVLSEPGSKLGVEGEQFVVRRGPGPGLRVRMQDVDRVLLLGVREVSGSALAACLRRGIDLVFLTRHGRYRGRLAGPLSKNAPLRLAQLRAAADGQTALRLARRIVMGKLTNQRRLLLRAQRALRDERLGDALSRMRMLAPRIAEAADLDGLRGLEGQAAALYFGVFGRLIRNPAFRFEQRSRRPPTDPVNACLSLGYTMLGIEMESLVAAAGLDPLVGFYHQPAYGRPSLALDLIEELRTVVVDQVVLRLINRRQLTVQDFEGARVDDPGLDLPPAAEQALTSAPAAETDAEAARSGVTPVFLGPVGRQVFFAELFRRLRESVFYPPRGARLRLRDVMREQVYALARELLGEEPGYEPFVPR